jgi:hypothetical protein
MTDVATIVIKPQMKMAIVADSAKKCTGSLSDPRWIPKSKKEFET